MMKKISAAALLAACLAAVAFSRTPVQSLSGTISLSGAWALYPMALKWAEEFQKLNPGVKIDVQAGGAGKGIADTLAGMVDVGMVSREIHPAEISKGALPLAVTKDGVVPTTGARNPFLAALRKKGMTRAQFIDIWITEKAVTWGQILGRPESAEIHVFTRSDACGAAETWAAFLGKRQEDLAGTGIYGDPGLADAVKRDPQGIGFNNINFAYDPKTLKPIDGVAILPIDLNANGVIDPNEDCYATRDAITRAIAENRYPSPPARDLYFVTKGRPAKPAVRAFLKWVLTEGQKFVPETGYIPLSADKLRASLDKLGAK